jgi:hypothetical protein
MHWPGSAFRTKAAASVLALFITANTTGAALAEGPFSSLTGRWTGQGRLGFAEGKTENITCRATYFVSDDGQKLDQNIRCASAGAKVEVKSNLTHLEGKLSGSWSELIYDKAGELTGEITKQGLRINVKGDDLNATMEIIVRDTKQLVEVHFNNSSLVGLTLILEKG